MKLKNFSLSIDIYKELELGNLALYEDHIEIYLSDIAVLKIQQDKEIARIKKLEIIEEAKKMAIMSYIIPILKEKLC